jgi:hypothetical protein
VHANATLIVRVKEGASRECEREIVLYALKFLKKAPKAYYPTSSPPFNKLQPTSLDPQTLQSVDKIRPHLLGNIASSLQNTLPKFQYQSLKHCVNSNLPPRNCLRLSRSLKLLYLQFPIFSQQGGLTTESLLQIRPSLPPDKFKLATTSVTLAESVGA